MQTASKLVIAHTMLNSKNKNLGPETYEDNEIKKACMTSETFYAYYVTTQFISILYLNFYNSYILICYFTSGIF